MTNSQPKQVTETKIYEEATSKLATSIDDAPVARRTEAEISADIEKLIDRDSPLYKVFTVGRLYKKNIPRAGSGLDVLLTFLKCYSEFMYMEHGYNNREKQTDIIKKTIQNIENSILIMKDSGIECDREKLLTLLKSFSI